MDSFDNDRDEVIQRFHDSDIEIAITIASDIESNDNGLKIAERYPFIYATAGIHPHDARLFNEVVYERLRALCNNKKIVAIGETGLDYYYDNSPRDIQRHVFRRLINLAKEVDFPVVIHSRDSKEDTLEIINDEEVSNGVLHCFSGDEEMAERAMAMGLYISFAGTVTFKNANRLREIVRLVPDDYLLVETDAPYLSPAPFRGKRNEPAHIIHTVKAISEVRGVSHKDIDRITTLNAKRLFRIGAIPVDGEIAYKIRDSLYLNVTNRCTNKCSFCVRFQKNFVKGHNLRLSHEPDEGELIAAIGDPGSYSEVVFCGYGEPLIRLDTVKSVSKWIKERGGKVRINTNGQGNLIHKRNILPELHGIVDIIFISLDAQDEETYKKLCMPVYENAYNSVIDFIKEAKKYIPIVTVTIVDAEGVDIEKCKAIAKDIGVGFRLRRLDIVG